MLPGFLQSKYQTYKEDTDILAKWLAVKATQCGYPPDLLSSPDQPTASSHPTQSSQRLKGAARKQAKLAAKENAPPSKDSNSSTDVPKYTIKIKEFTALAECIARYNKPAVKVPATVVNVLNRAIDLRQQHHERSRAQAESEPSADVEESNQTHAHFLGILERTREILKPRMPAETIEEFLSKPSARTSREDSDPGANQQINNMFDGLDVQEPSQAYLDAPTVDRATKDKAYQEPDFEAEQVQTIEEQYLAVHCLFQDLRSIRVFLRQLWACYRDGGLGLVAVSITTNTAIDFIRSMEHDCLQHFPGKSDYTDLMELFYGLQCLHRGHDPSDRQRPADPFNFAVYDLAEEIMLPTYIVLQGVQRVISPNRLPVYKPEYFEARDTSVDWTQKSDRDKYHDDSLVLMQAFPDLMNMTRMAFKTTLVEDELIRGIRQMSPGKAIPLWLVFAGQCFLDAQHLLGQGVTRGHTDLQQTANLISASIRENFFDFHKSLRSETWLRQYDAQFSDILKVIEEWVSQDVVANTIKAVKGAATVPPPEPFRLLKQYPLLCGLFSFTLQMHAQELGINFANARGSIMYASHLYNATRREKLLSRRWKDMALLIALQGTEKLFIGEPPNDFDGYLKRFLLSMGYSATVFASNRRRGAATASARGPRGLSELCAAGTLFKGRYCRNDQAVTWTIESIQPIIEAKMVGNSDDESSKTSSKVKTAVSGTLLRRSKRKRKSITTNDFLEDLAGALHAETLELSIDYLRLHRFSWELLRQVNDDCKPRLLEMFGAGYLEKESQLPHVVGYIFIAGTRISGVANLLRPRRGEIQLSNQLLVTAAKAIDGMIEAGAGEIETKFIAQRPGMGEIDLRARDILYTHK